jgi:dTDP-4-dehydrorhamnose reductase
LGRALARLCARRGIACVALGRSGLDIADPVSVRAALREVRPWGVINTAGFVRVDEAEEEPARCRRENTLGAAMLADACASREIRFATFSSDLVFDGRAARPYLESDPVAPLGVYGRSIAEAERLVAAMYPQALVIRTSAFFGPWDRYNFLWDFRNRLLRGETVSASEDTVISPTCVPEMVDSALDLFLDGEKGIWHLANSGAASWADLARAIAMLIGAQPEKVSAIPTNQMEWKAPRPRMSAMASERGCLLGPWQAAMERCLRQLAGSESEIPDLVI